MGIWCNDDLNDKVSKLVLQSLKLIHELITHFMFKWNWLNEPLNDLIHYKKKLLPNTLLYVVGNFPIMTTNLTVTTASCFFFPELCEIK